MFKKKGTKITGLITIVLAAFAMLFLVPPNAAKADTGNVYKADTGNVYKADTGNIHKADTGNVYYVAPNGEDARGFGSGSLANPFQHIEYAISQMRPGDTLIIRGGTYNEYIDLFDKNGSPSAWFTIKNYPGETVTFDGLEQTDPNKQEALIFNHCSYWNIEGLQITGYNGAGIYIKDGCTNFNIQGLKIWNLNSPPGRMSGTEGIMGYGNTGYITVQDCEIYDVGLKLNKATDHGIYIGYGAHDWTFQGNRIHDNSGAGIQLYGEPSGGSHCTITDNILYNNHHWGLVIGSNATGNTVSKNKFYDNDDSDVYLLQSSSGNSFQDNIFGSSTSLYNVAMGDPGSTNNTFDYDIYGKADRTVYYGAKVSLTMGFTDWQKYSQEAHGYYDAKAADISLGGKSYTTKRLSGDNRFDTAKSIAEEYNSGSVQNVVLASGSDFPDALSGSVLAAKLKAPILLAGPDPSGSPGTMDYIENHLSKSGNIYILGGTGAISEDFRQTLESLGYNNITRLSGADRYETNQKINDALNVAKGTPVVIASGESFPDALSISSVAGLKGYPIILSEYASLPAQAEETLKEIQPSAVYVIGGTGVISDSVLGEIKSLTGLPDSSLIRIWGNDRYETSINVAKYFNLPGDTVTLASGENFPDALAGSVLSSKLNAPIILISGDISRQKQYLDSTHYINEMIFGGSGVISDSIVNQLAS